MNISVALPFLVAFVGAYFLYKLDFFFVLHPVKSARNFVFSLKKRESRRAFFLALAGTLGVGNIFGVAAGLIYGGAGMVFWLAVSSLFSAVIKYSECALSSSASDDGRGGMHLVLRSTFPRSGKLLALIYTVACTLLAFFMGGAMQVTAVTGALSSLSDIDALVPSAIFAILVLFGTLGGGERIEKNSRKL